MIKDFILSCLAPSIAIGLLAVFEFLGFISNVSMNLVKFCFLIILSVVMLPFALIFCMIILLGIILEYVREGVKN